MNSTQAFLLPHTWDLPHEIPSNVQTRQGNHSDKSFKVSLLILKNVVETLIGERV